MVSMVIPPTSPCATLDRHSRGSFSVGSWTVKLQPLMAERHKSTDPVAPVGGDRTTRTWYRHGEGVALFGVVLTERASPYGEPLRGGKTGEKKGPARWRAFRRT